MEHRLTLFPGTQTCPCRLAGPMKRQAQPRPVSALAGCAVVFIRDTPAPQLGITVDAIEATAQCETDARGCCWGWMVSHPMCECRLTIAIRRCDEMRFVGSTKPGRNGAPFIWRSPKRSLCGDDARHQAALGRKHAANRGNEILVEGSVRRHVELMRRIKAALRPHGILKSGKLF